MENSSSTASTRRALPSGRGSCERARAPVGAGEVMASLSGRTLGVRGARGLGSLSAQGPPLEASTELVPAELLRPLELLKPVSDELLVPLVSDVPVLLPAVVLLDPVLVAAIAAAVPPAPTSAAAASDAVSTRTRGVPRRRVPSVPGSFHCWGLVIASPRGRGTRGSAARTRRGPAPAEHLL